MRKITSVLLALIMLLSMVTIPALAANPLLSITDDFENGLNTSIWRYDNSGALIKSVQGADGTMNSAAYLPYNSSGNDTKNHRLRNNQKYLNITDHAVIKFDLMVDSAAKTDEYLRLYGVDSAGNAITSYYLLSYHYSNNYLYINGKGNAKVSLENDTWCSIIADVDLTNGKYSVYVNGNIITNNDGTTVFDIPYSGSYTGSKYGPGATLREVEIMVKQQGGAIWVDNISIAKRFYADPDSDYGFFDAYGAETSTLDPTDTVYKATLVNNGVNDEKVVFYLAGYDTADSSLKDITVRQYTVKKGSTLNIEEHLKYLGDEVTAMKYKAFYVKGDNTLTPYSADTLLLRTEADSDTSYEDDTEPYKHVFIIGVDGMGTFSRNHEGANDYINTVFADGNITYDMRVSVPTVSSHSWASCLTGVTPDLHGLNSNTLVETTARDTNSKYPTILSIVNEQIPDAKVASIAVWGGINTGIVETEEGIYKYKDKDANVCTEVLRYIDEEIPSDGTSLTYVHFNSPDAHGHANGYGSDATINADYLNEVRYCCWMISKINTALKDKGILDDTLFIVTSDHGGTTVYKEDGTPYGEHGGLTDAEKYAIFAIKGKSVVTDAAIGDMEIRDTAAIALYALGLDVPSYMSARVPANIFEGVPQTERSVYYDPDNPRYNVPTVTPAKTSADYVTKYITDKDLITYLPFDGNTTANAGANATANGSVEYVPGYFGNAACLNEGYISLDSFAPGNDSFTISMWVKSAMAYKDAPLIANKVWQDTAQGFVFAFNRSSDTSYGSKFNFADGTNKMEAAPSLPSDYDRGWMHVMLIVDRSANTVSISYDFAEPIATDIPASLVSASMTGADGKLYIGEDATGAHAFKMGLSVDEFMIFDGAFDINDIAALKEYYNK